jgi:hypothetical protein
MQPWVLRSVHSFVNVGKEKNSKLELEGIKEIATPATIKYHSDG